MIAITFALPAESSGVIGRLERKLDLKISGMRVVSGQLAGRDVHIIHTGVGEKVAQATITRYLEGNAPSLLISSGFAGATRSTYRLGDLILAHNFSDPSVLTAARRVLRDQNVHTVAIWTVPAMIDSLAERDEIWNRHEAAAIDMETHAIAQVCAAHGLPMLSVRVLSDTPRHPFGIPSHLLFDIERQRTPMLRLLGYLVTHPAKVPAIVRLSSRIGRVRRSLTETLVKIVQADLPI